MDNPFESHADLLSPAPPASETLLAGEDSFQRELRRAVLWPVGALLLGMGLLFGLLVYLFYTASRADHSNAVLAQISLVEKLAVDMETGVRGYRITADPRFLEPFQKGSIVFSSEVDRLEQLTRDNPAQLVEVSGLRQSHRAWTDFATNVRKRVQAQMPADLAVHLRGKELMDGVRAHLIALRSREHDLLTARAATRNGLRRLSLAAILICAIVLVPVTASSVRRAMSHLRAHYHDALGTVANERERLRVTLSSIGDAVVATDAAGRVTYMNPVAVDLTGWSVAEASGRLLPEVFRIVNEHTRAPVDDPVQHVLRVGEVVGLANHTVLISKEGHETPIADSAAPIRNRDGVIIGVVLVFRDQTGERAALQKAEWLASFPETNPNPIVEVDFESGELVYANSYAVTAFPDLKSKGFDHEFFAGLKEAIPGLHAKPGACVRRETTVGGHSYVQTVCHLPASPRLRVHCSDITESKSVAAALRQSDERFRQVFEHAATGIALGDAEGGIEQCNPAFSALLGYTESELIGINAIDLIHPSDKEKCRDLVRCLQRGELPFYELESRYLRKDGQPVWVHKFVSMLRDPTGAPVHLVALVTDIDERKQTQLLIDSQKHSLEMIVAGQPLSEVLIYLARTVERLSEGQAIASILLLDSDGLLRNGGSPSLPLDYLNAIDGLKPSATVGTCSAAAATGKMIITPDIACDPAWQTLKHLPLALGFAAAWSQPILAKDGKVLGTFGTYFRERRQPSQSERQLVEVLSRTAALAIERQRIEDDRERAEDALRHSQSNLALANEQLASRACQLDQMVEARTAELRETVQELERFSYSIVHDMRAPLRSMRSFAGFLFENHAERLDDVARDYLRRIMGSAGRMDALITDVLTYSRVSRNAADLTTIDLDQLVPEIIEQYPNLQEKSSSIQMVRPLPQVLGNTALLTQVFSNLLENALKFVPPNRDPRVQLRAESNCDSVRIWIEDNGIGILPEHRERIFGLFQRLQRPQQFAGTGVGLAIVKRAVEKMGGKTGVDSVPEEGSRFWIDLRLAERPSAPGDHAA